MSHLLILANPDQLQTIAGSPGFPGFDVTDLTGATGPRQLNLAAEFSCAPCMRRSCDYQGASEVMPACFGTLPPAQVFARLLAQMAGEDGAANR